jgi:anti-sigma factor RsiW
MVTDCQNYKNELSSYMDGELDLPTASQIAEHLKACSPCQQELTALKGLSALFVQAQKKIVAPDILAGILEKLPNTCSLISEDLSAYMDGELAETPAEGIKLHLENCPPCATSYKDLEATEKLLSQGLAIADDLKLDLWPAIRSHMNEDCALIQSELSSFIDQEVPPLRHRAIVGHLLDCPSCHQNFNSLYQVGDALRSNYQPVWPEDFDLWPGVKAKLQVVPMKARPKQATAIRPFSLNKKLYAVAASFAAILISGTFFYVGAKQPIVRPVTSEGYLLEQALVQPAENAELVLYENP